jgi:hypothetical protein
VLPPLYQFRVRSRIFRWYAQLRDIEYRDKKADADRHDELLQELDSLDNKVERIKIPLSYADELYALRNNIQLVRNRLQRN